MYEFLFEEETSILLMAVSGFFPPEAMGQFERDFRAAVADARRRAPRLRLLVDGREGAVLAAETATRIQALDAEIASRPGDLAATVVSSALTKLQMRRLFENETKRIFRSFAAAHAWLAGERHAQEAAAA